MFILVNPSEDVIKALEYVYLANAINIFQTADEAVEFIEIHNIF